MQADGKIQSFNTAVEWRCRTCGRVAVDSPSLSVSIRVVTFGTDVCWVDELAAIETFLATDSELQVSEPG